MVCVQCMNDVCVHSLCACMCGVCVCVCVCVFVCETLNISYMSLVQNLCVWVARTHLILCELPGFTSFSVNCQDSPHSLRVARTHLILCELPGLTSFSESCQDSPHSLRVVGLVAARRCRARPNTVLTADRQGTRRYAGRGSWGAKCCEGRGQRLHQLVVHPHQQLRQGGQVAASKRHGCMSMRLELQGRRFTNLHYY